MKLKLVKNKRLPYSLCLEVEMYYKFKRIHIKKLISVTDPSSWGSVLMNQRRYSLNDMSLRLQVQSGGEGDELGGLIPKLPSLSLYFANLNTIILNYKDSMNVK